MDSVLMVVVRWFGALESVRVKVGVLVPVDVGVPVIAPEEFIVRPAGNPLTDQVYGKVPPLPAMLAEYWTPTIPPDSVVVLIDGPAAMVIDRFVVVTLRWFGLLASVRVKLGVLVPAAVGVPEIAP